MKQWQYYSLHSTTYLILGTVMNHDTTVFKILAIAMLIFAMTNGVAAIYHLVKSDK